MLCASSPEHGDHDLLVLGHWPHAHPDVGVLHGGLPAHGVARHAARLAGPDDGELARLPGGPGLQPQLAVRHREPELARPLVDAVQPLPHGAHGHRERLLRGYQVCIIAHTLGSVHRLT